MQAPVFDRAEGSACKWNGSHEYDKLLFQYLKHSHTHSKNSCLLPFFKSITYAQCAKKKYNHQYITVSVSSIKQLYHIVHYKFMHIHIWFVLSSCRAIQWPFWFGFLVPFLALYIFDWIMFIIILVSIVHNRHLERKNIWVQVFQGEPCYSPFIGGGVWIGLGVWSACHKLFCWSNNHHISSHFLHLCWCSRSTPISSSWNPKY